MILDGSVGETREVEISPTMMPDLMLNDKSDAGSASCASGVAADGRDRPGRFPV